jgi:hypothetical protein
LHLRQVQVKGKAICKLTGDCFGTLTLKNTGQANSVQANTLATTYMNFLSDFEKTIGK